MEDITQPKTKKEIVKMLLKNKELETEDEEQLMEILFNEPIAIDVDRQMAEKETFGDKIADKLTSAAGSWGFILLFMLFLLVWIFLNLTLIKELDPYPFILLNLVLSCVAALQAPVILMSQNRTTKRDSLRSKNDYKSDLKSELILEELHDQIKKIIANQNKILKLLEKDTEEKE